MSELHDRFEKLARRGTARGADAVLAAAHRDAEGAGALAGVDDHTTVDGGDGLAPVVDLQPVELQHAPSGRRRRRTGSMVAAGGVAATLFVGVLAIGSFVGSGGGSDSPEGAVRQLASAVAHGDPLAAADVLAPEEVRSLDGTVNAATKRAQELTLVQNASAPLSGLDLSVDNLNLSTQSLGNGYAKVVVDGGTISARTDKPKFSPLMQKVLRNSGDNSASADLSKLAHSNGLPTFVVTVQHDGHWYISAAYTVLEYIREVNHLPAADFGSGVRATATLGADTPDAAVTGALQALSHGDWQKLIALAPPDEIPVYDYRAAILQLAADSHPDFTVDKVATASTVSGDTAKVKLTASGTDSSGGTWSVDGSCFTGTGGSQSFGSVSSSSASGGSGPPATSSSQVIASPATECGVGRLFFLFDLGGSHPTSDAITTVREDGRWFVSPVGTILGIVDNAIASITQRQLYTLLNVPDLLPPDGTYTLGTPVKVSGNQVGAAVYTFTGHQGERLLGLAKSTPENPAYGFDAQVRVFGPDGKELDLAYAMLQGQALDLPADGTYRFVIQSFQGTDSTVTIWDEAQAPDAARHPSGYGGCTFTATGEKCSSAGGFVGAIPGSSTGNSTGSVTATSVPGG
jgi:hypothetical protein